MANGNGKHNGNGNDNGNGNAICGALLKRCRSCNYKFTADDTRTGVDVCPTCGTARGRCQSTQTLQNGRCIRHGGASLSGMAHPRYQGKGYSKYLPQRILADYDAAINDTSLIELRSEMAVIEARVAALFRQMGSGESGVTWRKAQDAMRELMIAIQTQDADAQATAIQGLRTTIDRGVGEYAVWEEVVSLFKAKASLISTETRRVVAAKQFVTLDKLGILLDAIQQSVIDQVQDRSTLARIQREWNLILSGSHESALASGESDPDRDDDDDDA
jgi:hypothetical protein